MVNHEKGNRFVPITFGLLCNVIAITISWLFGDFFIVNVIVGIISIFGLMSIWIGISASQKVINEMTSSLDEPLSKESEEELKKKMLFNIFKS